MIKRVEILSTIPGDAYGIMSGTGMAAPLVSGTAALIITNNPGIRPDDVRRIIIEAGSNPETKCEAKGIDIFTIIRTNHVSQCYILKI